MQMVVVYGRVSAGRHRVVVIMVMVMIRRGIRLSVIELGLLGVLTAWSIFRISTSLIYHGGEQTDAAWI